MFATLSRGSLGPNDSSNLLVAPNIPVTPSFEDLASIASGTISFPADNSSGSGDSVEENYTASDIGETLQLASKENPSPELSKRKQVDAKSKRHMYRSSRHSSSELMLHNHLGDVDADQNGTRFPTPRTADVKEKRNDLLRIHQVGESDPTLLSGTERGQGHRTSTVFPESASEGDLASKGGRELRPRHVYKATGIAT